MTDEELKDEDLEDEDLDEDEESEEDESDEEDEDENLDDEESEEDDKESEQKAPKQSPQKNEFYKNLRLREKEEAKIREDERKKVLLESVNHTNPYTNQPIIDEEDEEEFFTMRELEKKGKNPVEDYSSYLKEKKREEKRTQSKTFDTQTDLMDFKKSYPNVNVSELMKNKDFIDLFGEELGKVSLKTLYKAYEKTADKVENKKKEDLKAKRDSKNPGSLSGTNNRGSIKDVAKMDINDPEFEKMLARARRGELTSE